MTDFDRTPPDVAQIAEVIRGAGFPCDHISRISGGWSYWTFDVGGHLIARFPRSESIAKSLQREITFLPHISSHVPFSVPEFRYVGSFRERCFVVYERIPGSPVSFADLSGRTAAHLASALVALHTVPPQPLGQGHPAAASVDSWRERYLSLRREAADTLPALVESSLLCQLDNRWATFLDLDLETLSGLSVVHCDLGPEHILVDASDRTIAGIIDFEEVMLGDPAIDFVGLWCNFGPGSTRRLLQLYDRSAGAAFEARIRFYSCMGSYHAIEHGLSCGDNDTVADGVAGLRKRVLAETAGNW